MNARYQKLFRTVKNRDGFTLIEMLIVIIILGILAMVIIPQITVSTEDAKVSTLKTNLSGIRGTIEVYYAQHNMIYPGMVLDTDGTTATSDSTAVDAFTKQLTLYSDITGKVSPTKTTAFPLGPYIKGGSLPTNPFRITPIMNDIVCDIAAIDITLATGLKRAATGATAWKYLPKLGIIFANDETSPADTDTPHKQY